MSKRNQRKQKAVPEMKTPEIKQETTWSIEKTADGYHWFKTIRTKGGKK